MNICELQEKYMQSIFWSYGFLKNPLKALFFLALSQNQ